MTGLDSLLEVCYPQGNQATHHLDRFSVYGPVHMISMHFNSIPPNSQESVFSVFLGSVSPLEELRFSPRATYPLRDANSPRDPGRRSLWR